MRTHTYIRVLETVNDLSKQTHAAHIIFPNAFGKENDSAVTHSLKNTREKKKKRKDRKVKYSSLHITR
jgi:hypothetical protein